MRLIVVMGGVISGVGKGIATASIGKILQEYGYSVTAVKIDPYINYDAGTLRPTEHGEVWVTDDGGEIDQDLGNYERFLGYELSKRNCITTGQVYAAVIEKERKGEYLGKTVEFIPHIPDEIKNRVKEAARKKDGTEYDFVVIEIGGTMGEYQNLPFLFAVKSLEIELGKENVSYVLVTYLPVPENVGEMKTKPTQLAIRHMREHGIEPDFVICRSHSGVDEIRKKKIETYANVETEHVINAPDIDTVYRVPLNFEKDRLGHKILDKFSLKPKRTPDWSSWQKMIDYMTQPKKRVRVAMVGKYVDTGNFSLADSYISVNEALRHAGAANGVGVDIEWVDAKQVEKDGASALEGYAGVIVPGGFGSSGVEGKIAAIKYARENNMPFLGLCYGMQLAVAEYARNKCGMEDANTTEVNPETKNPVIDVIGTQREILEESRYGGTMRLGAYAASLKSNTRVTALYLQARRLESDRKKLEAFVKNGEKFRVGSTNHDNIIFERHRHRYEVNPKHVDVMEKSGIVFSGSHTRSDGTELMEFVELPDHKFFVGTQAHPEFMSRPGSPAPLFYGFVKACAG